MPSDGTAVICEDCPYQDVWYPVRTEREKCKHDLVHEGHTVEYTDPDELSKVVTMDGEVVKRLDEQADLVTDGGVTRPAVCVDTLDYNGAETHQDSIEGEVTRHYYDCPNCGHPISTWMDCPECLWYDEDVWQRTLNTATNRDGDQS